MGPVPKLGSRVGVVASVVVAAALLGGCASPRWRATLVSVNPAGTSGGNSQSHSPAFSPDGTKIAFGSFASDLGATDTNEANDIYMRDLVTGTTTLLSTNAAGTQAANDASTLPVFSPDGTRVAFTSEASDLGPTDLNGVADVYVRDLATGATTLVSVNDAGTSGGNAASETPAFSPDGTQLMFVSQASDLGPTDSPRVGWGQHDIYIHDLVSGTTNLVSVDATGDDSGDGVSWAPVFSPDGTKIAFVSGAGDLGPVDTNGWGDLYLRDLSTGTTSLVSVDASGTGGGNQGMIFQRPVFSPDGTEVYFDSPASNLVTTPDDNGTSDIFVRDLAAGTTTLFSTGADGTSSANGGSTSPVLSPDGTSIAFTSTADDLGSTDTNDANDIYRRDIETRTTTLVSVTPDGGDSGNGLSGGAAFSADGNLIVFGSFATNLGATDTRSAWDVYVRDLTTGVTRLVSINGAGTDSANSTSGNSLGAVSPTDPRIAFLSDANDLGPADMNDVQDIYLAALS